jgi:hypothetical protein
LRSVGPQAAPSTAQRFRFDVAVLNLFCFGHLTRRANQGHIGIIADIVEPAPETVAGFCISQDNHQGGFDLSKSFRRIFRSLLTFRKWFDMSGKSPA